MGIHKNSIQFPTGSGSVKDTATGFSSGFGRQTNTVFGTFPNQNNHQQNANNTTAAFGSQHNFGNNFFNNTGFFQPFNFGFGHTMSQQTTNICFTGFGQHKTNYSFSNSSIGTMKKVTLVFEHPDIIFGSSIFRKPDTIVEIEELPISNRNLITNYNNFSFSVGRIEKYNSTFIMKSATPIKFLVKVKQPGFSFNNTMSSSLNYGNRKITLTFQSDQLQYIPNTNILRPSETIVEIPLPFINKSTFSNEDFMFSVGPDGANNSFEIQTSKNDVFKVTFLERGNYNNNQLFGNRETRTGSVFFDQGRQINAFPTTSGSLFGGQAPSAFGANQSFGSSTTTAGYNGLPLNQVQPINSNQPLFGSPSVNYGFGATQSLGNATTGTAGTANQKVGKSHPNKSGFSFGQTNMQTIGAGNSRLPVFGQLYGNSKPKTGVIYCNQGLLDLNEASNDSSSSETFASLFTNPTTFTEEVISFQDKVNKELTSVHYQPTFDTDVLGNPIKTNCITAMKEYADTSLEELRVQDYLRTSCEPSKENNMTTEPDGKTTNSNTTNILAGYSPLQNKIGNTNQAFFEQLHQLIPYLNAGSFCKCVRSCNAAKNQNNTSIALATNSQPRTNGDSLDNLYDNTQKPRLNDNITIDEFYEDVFKYLEYIQKQYRHLESTLNIKNATNIPEKHSNKEDESNKTSNQNNTPKSPIPVFGCSTYAAVNAASSLNENNTSINPGSENDVPAVEKVTSIFENVEPKKSLLFGMGVSNKIDLSTSKPLEASAETKLNFPKFTAFPIYNTSKNDDAVKTNETSKTEDLAILKPEESNRNSSQNTKTYPVSLFGNLTSSAVNASSSSSNPGSENNTSTALAKNSNIIFGSSAFTATGEAVSSCSTTAGNLKKNDNVEPTKSLFFGTGFITSGKTDDAIKMKENDDQSNGITSSSTEENSTGLFSLTLPSSKPEKLFADFIFSTNDTTSNNTVEEEKSTSVFSATSQMPEKTLTAPIFSTKDTRSGSTVGKNSIGLFSFAFSNTLTTPIFSTTDMTSRSSRVGGKSTNSFFSLTAPSQMPKKTVTAPIYSTKSTSSSYCTVDEKKSTGFFSFNIPSNKPDNIFTVPLIFATNKNTTSSSTMGDNVPSTKSDKIEEIDRNAKKTNVSDSDVAESTVNDSPTKENFINESDNGGSPGGINIVKAVNSLRSIISNDNATQGRSPEEKIGPTEEIDEPMDEQGSSKTFKMKKISDIIADIEEEDKHEDSLTKFDSDSDISNYSLITNRSSNEDSKENASHIQTEEHPTGIVMTRYGYYTLPSLEDLKSNITADGACVVPNFTIGRKGYGSICFNKEINVAGLNVNDIVHFRNKEIIIYPNENNNKPEAFSDLKKCDVLVTLEQVWPHDATKHGPIKDPQHLDKIKYEDKLRLVCHKNDVNFVDYRPEIGCWLFKMKQFTKKNINCWDVEDDEEIFESKSSTGIPKIIKFKQPDKTEEPPAKKFSF